MQKKLSRILSFLLATIIILSAVPFTVSAATTLIWPVPGHQNLTQPYKGEGVHDGIDISDSTINGADVVSVIGGKVKYKYTCTDNHYGSNKDCDGFGTGLIIYGDDKRYYQYAHLLGGSIPSDIKVGATVTAGTVIGKVGNTGNSEGAHLHFEINLTDGWHGSVNPMNETYIENEAHILQVYYNANGGSISSDDYKISSNVIYKKSDSTKYYQKWTYNNARDNGLVNWETFGIYKEGYTFAGWGTKSTGGTVFGDRDSTIVPTDITSEIKNGDCSVTLYAQWEPNTLQVYYNANGGSISSDDYKISSDIIYKKSDSTKYYQKWTYNNARENGLVNWETFGIYKEGYTFAGWGTKSTGGTVFGDRDTTIVPTDLNSNIKNGNCSITLYAIWTKNTYNLYFNSNGGSGTMSKKTVSFDENFTFPKNTFTKTGYTFNGWNIKRNSDNKWYVTSKGWFAEEEINANGYTKNLYADERNLTFDYSWIKGYDGISDYTFYANWRKNNLKVYYNANGGSVSSNTYTLINNVIYKKEGLSEHYHKWTYNESQTNGLTNTITFELTREGYSFIGWGTTPSGGTIFDQNNTELLPTDITAEIKNGDCEVTLYAIWKKSTYAVSYNTNGGSNAPTSQTKTYGTNLKLSSTVPTKSTYNFVCWNTKADGTGTSYQPGDTYTANANLSLYAIWKHDTFSLGNDTLNIDKTNALISGRDLFGISQAQLEAQFGNGNMKVTMKDKNRVATGTMLELVDVDNLVYDTLTVVIFGDVNGDGWYDGNDAFLVNLIVNGMLDKDDVGEAVWTAADCNHDSVIDKKDVDLLTGAGLLLNNVDQSAKQAELEANTFYIEYMGLIDQSVDVDINDNTNIDDNVGQGLAPAETGNTDFEAIFMNIIAFIQKIFSYLFSIIF